MIQFMRPTSYLALSNGDGERARRLWRRFEPELRLLDGGWSPVELRDRFVIELPPEALARALARLRERSEQLIGAHIAEPKPGVDLARRAVQVLAACRSVGSQLADEPIGARS